ncbi:MAG: DNA polymerase I [Planctomycetia bacterium]|nr:DNA polymerase I [Planctomycetia bacterium]
MNGRRRDLPGGARVYTSRTNWAENDEAGQKNRSKPKDREISGLILKPFAREKTGEKVHPEVPTLYLIDSHAQLYAAYYALGGLASPRGEKTGAVFGFISMLLKVMGQYKPDYLAATFDMPGLTFRHEKFEQYKAQRKEMPDDLQKQIEWVREILGVLGVPMFQSEGFEADDCIATLTRQALEEGCRVVICSRDKDLQQLISPRVKMLDAKNNEMLDEAWLKENKGITPSQVVDLLALMGDASDNVPGVPGIGPKSASALIAEFNSLGELYGRLDEVKGKRGQLLAEHRDQAFLSRDLIQLTAEVPITLNLDQCRLPEEFDRDRLRNIFHDHGFGRFIKQMGLEASDTVEVALKAHLIDTPAKLKAFAKQLNRQQAFAVDTETTSLNPAEAKLVGMSFSWSEGEGYYIPVRGPEPEKCLAEEEVIEAVRPALTDEKKLKIGQNLKYDIVVLANAGVTIAEPMFDTMVAAYLLDPGRREYGLDVLARDMLNRKTTPISELIGKGKEQRSMAEVPIQKVTEYAVEDAAVAYQLRGTLERQLDEAGLRDLTTHVEMPLVPVLAEMERTGVSIDTAVLERISGELGEQLVRLAGEIHESAGRQFNIDSPKQLAAVLFEELKITPVKRTAGKAFSTDNSVLERLADLHPVPRLVILYRQAKKLKSTYVDALPKMVSPRTGRVHTSFNQTATTTGRLSSSNPNLQNIPIRSEQGRQIRTAFVAPEDGLLLLAADYSQIELRLLAHYSHDTELVHAFEHDQDIHAFVAAQIFGAEVEDVTSEMRATAKMVNFSLIYGKSAYGLSRDLDISIGQAAKFIDEYFERYKGVKDFTTRVLEGAKSAGYVTTLLGRRRYIDGIKSTDARHLNAPERAAINTVIQGSAADMIKVAMVNIHQRIRREARPSRMILQIHDELVFEVPQECLKDESDFIVEEMAGAIRLDVPMKVNVAAGKNWLEVNRRPA